MAYQFQHSVEVGVSQEAAWRFWTNVENWTLDVAIEWVKLDGFFQAGVQGTTKTRGADLVQWEIAEVSKGESAVIEYRCRKRRRASFGSSKSWPKSERG